jgi:GxxExxY protein
MNTDRNVYSHVPSEDAPDLADVVSTKFLLKQETHEILGCAFEVINELGHGLNEKNYENALVVEFAARKIPYHQQKRFDVLYKQHPVGLYIPDLIAYSSLIVDTKVIDRITDHERGQMLNYLRITKLRVGLILNFKFARLQFERVVR